jgi:hypothetical protein
MHMPYLSDLRVELMVKAVEGSAPAVGNGETHAAAVRASRLLPPGYEILPASIINLLRAGATLADEDAVAQAGLNRQSVKDAVEYAKDVMSRFEWPANT